MADQDRSSSKLKLPLLEERNKSQRAQSQQQSPVSTPPPPPPTKVICGLDVNLIALSTMNFFLNAAISIVIPFFPPIASNLGVSQTIIGLILAFNPIGSFLVSLIVAQMMGRLGKKNLMYWGLIFQALTIASFGAFSNLKNKTVFVCLSILSRFIQGAARSAYGSSTFGYVPQLWPDTVQKKISIMETLTALGSILGPMIGQVLYSALGNQIPFYVLSFLFFCCLFTIRWLPPDNRQKKDLERVSSVKCLLDKNIFMTFLVLVGSTAAQTYINTLYTIHMDNLGLDEDTSGYFFSLGSILYMAFLHLMPKLSKYFNRKLILTVGTFISVLGAEVQAPEKYLGIPGGENRWYIVTIGQCITNVAFAMCVLPMIPELISLVLEKEIKERKILVADQKLSRACSDMSSGIFMAGYSLGLFIGPFGSGILYDVFGGNDIDKFMNTSRCIAGFLFVVFILYLTIGGSYKGFKQQSKLVRSLSQKSYRFNEDVIREKQQKLDIEHMNKQQKANNQDSEIITSSELKDGLINQLEIKIDQGNDNQQERNCTLNDLHADSDVLLSDDNDEKEFIISEGRDSFGENENETILSYEEVSENINQPLNVNRSEKNY